jgi:hypothetical protein
MTLRLPVLPRSFRWLVIAWGGAIFLWISLEDNPTLPVAILGVGSAALITLSRLFGRIGGHQIRLRSAWLGAPLVGGVVGAVAAVFTALLMFLKTAMHAHIFPDYPTAQILAMLQRAPAWGAAGVLIGLGYMLAWWSMRDRVDHDRSVS